MKKKVVFLFLIISSSFYFLIFPSQNSFNKKINIKEINQKFKDYREEKKKPIIDTYYEFGMIFVSNDNELYNIRFSTNKNKFYINKINFNGKKINEKIVSVISDKKYYNIKENWNKFVYRNYNLEKDILYHLISKKIKDIEINIYVMDESKFPENTRIYIAYKNKKYYFNLKYVNIYNLLAKKVDNKYYIFLVSGTGGSGSFSSMLLIFEI